MIFRKATQADRAAVYALYRSLVGSPRCTWDENYPGWLYEVNMGATTVWERWNSVMPDGHMSSTGMNSLNHYAYGAVMGASLIGGVWEMVQGFLIKPLRRFFPPVVTGVVVTAIGLSLIPVGIGFFGGGSASADYGALWNLFLGLVTLIVILIFKHACTGFLSVASILLGIIAGYLVSFLMGLVLPHTAVIDGKEVVCGYITDWAQVKDAAWFAIPQWMPVKFQFNIGAIVPMLIMFVVTAVETVGDTAGMSGAGVESFYSSTLLDISSSLSDRLGERFNHAKHVGSRVQITVDA